MAKSGQAGQLRLADGLADFKSIEELIAHLSIQESSIDVEANVGFKDGHRCLAYDLIRTPNLNRAGFEAVPPEAIGLFSFALGEAESSRVETAQKTIKNLTGLDIGREIFANIEQITLFVLPPSEDSNKTALAKVFSPVLPRIGLVMTSHNPQKTRQLLAKLLTMTELVTSTQTDEQPGEQTTAAEGKYRIGMFDNQQAYCYMGQAGQSTILALSPEVLQACLSSVKNGRSILTDGPLRELVSVLPSETSKLALVNVGGAIRSADAHIKGVYDNPYNPVHQQLGQLAQACDKTSVQLLTAENINSFGVHLSVKEIPPLAGVFPLLMQLSMSNLQAKVRATEPLPAPWTPVAADSTFD